MNVFSCSFALGVAAAATFAVAGCAGGDTTAGSTSTQSTPVSASTTASSVVQTSSDSPSSVSDTAGMQHNDADVTFSQLMIVHHQGAIEMADLAADRAQSQQVKDLAASIKAAQAPEIELMTSWLTAWGAPLSAESSSAETHGDMTGMGMPDMGSTASGMDMPTTVGMDGMMTADDMAALAAASGVAFDKMFLEMMVAHHQGAVEMAGTEIANGSSADAISLAEAITTSQTAEIATMMQMLQSM